MPVHHGVYWLRGTGRVGDPDQGPLLPHGTAVERLRWMLAHTMGSPRAFAHRQWELQGERAAAGQHDPVSDEDVVESYRQSCHPGTGEMAQYLEACQLVVRLGEVAFVHGALPLTNHNLLRHSEDETTTSLWDDLSFAMPWLEPGVTARDVGVESIDDWIEALNQFARERVQTWRSTDGASDGIWALRGGYHLQSREAQPFGQLIQYGMGSTPDRVPNPTVVYNTWGVSTRVSGKPRKFFRHEVDSNQQDQSYVRHTREFFERTGVRLVCSGHQPSGELPNHIRVPHGDDQTSWILSCDTSYSGDAMRLILPGDNLHNSRENLGRGDARSGRGSVAVSEVLIKQRCDTGAVLDAYCHGTLSDGTAYQSESIDFSGTSLRDDSGSGLAVGTLASGPLVPNQDNSPHGGPWWTQAALTDGSFLLAAGEGFKLWTRMVRP